MAYNSAIPQATDFISTSQQDILNNFSAINTFVNVNHVAFNGADQGKHLYLQMPEHAAPTTGGNEAGLYANVGATSGVTELYFRREGNGASIAFTEATAPNSNLSAGWTRLPSGVVIKWGSHAATGNATFTWTSDDATFPGFTYVYQVMVCVGDGAAGDVDEAIRLIGASGTGGGGTNNFTVYGSKRTSLGAALVQFRYIAIGK